VALLNEGLRALQTAPPPALSSEHAAHAEHATSGDGDSDGRSGRLELWRGVSNLEVTRELLTRGGTLIAPTAFSTSVSLAKSNAAAFHAPKLPYPPTLLKVSMADAAAGMAACDVRFLSCFPREAMFLLPPGTYLHCPTGDVHMLPADGTHPCSFVQIDLVPTPLKGAWVPAADPIAPPSRMGGAGGGLTPRTPRAGGVATPRGASTPRGLSPTAQPPADDTAVGLW
jgi:hypothetical protein